MLYQNPDYEGELKTRESHRTLGDHITGDGLETSCCLERERRKHLLTHALNTNSSCRETAAKEALGCLAA